MIHYVAGLLFDTDHQAVVLILKNCSYLRAFPECAQWEAVVGKVTPGEELDRAQSREFLEETGVSMLPRAWTRFLTLKSAARPHVSMKTPLPPESWEVDFFHAALPLAALKRARTTEIEQVRAFQLFELHAIPDDALVQNLRWIIPMALAHADGAAYHVVSGVA